MNVRLTDCYNINMCLSIYPSVTAGRYRPTPYEDCYLNEIKVVFARQRGHV